MVPRDAPPARFCDRLNAFALDASLFACGGLASAFAVAAARGSASPRFLAAWLGLWGALFVAYHAALASDGRRTVGKRLLGLAVVDADGGDPDVPTAVLRAAAYAVSGLAGNLGFLWALRGGRAWHDLLAGTRVVQAEERAPAARAASAVAAWLAGGAMVAAWIGLVAIGPGLARMRLLANARVALKSLAYLEEARHQRAGAYTADLSVLLGETDEARGVARALPAALDPESVSLELTDGGYAVEATALDAERTRLRVEGPARPR